MKIALGQIASKPGDLKGNAKKIIEMAQSARGHGAHVIAFPQMSLCGYPLWDIINAKGFVEEQGNYLEEIASSSKESIILQLRFHSIRWRGCAFSIEMRYTEGGNL